MRKLRASRIGIDQGDTEIFSDFEHGGEMWTGTGPRERRKSVTFSEPFSTAPSVQVSLSLWDMDSAANARAEALAEDITETGCDLVFRTWMDTRVARVRMSWTAIGEIADEDSWDLY